MKPQETKQCGRCGKELPLSMFRLRSNGVRNKLCGVCCGAMTIVGCSEEDAQNGTLRCNHCGVAQPIVEFRTKRTGRRNRTCNTCCEKASASFMEFNGKHDNKYYKMRSARVQEVKREVIEHYGGCCACCGETDVRFLSLDHKNGDGAEHRKQLARASGSRIWYWARNNGYPPIFQVLCYNCNFAKGRKHQCPHQSDPFDPMRLVSAC